MTSVRVVAGRWLLICTILRSVVLKPLMTILRIHWIALPCKPLLRGKICGENPRKQPFNGIGMATGLIREWVCTGLLRHPMKRSRTRSVVNSHG